MPLVELLFSIKENYSHVPERALNFSLFQQQSAGATFSSQSSTKTAHHSRLNAEMIRKPSPPLLISKRDLQYYNNDARHFTNFCFSKYSDFHKSLLFRLIGNEFNVILIN